MGWIDIAWPMVGAVSLTLGLIYLLVWVRKPDRYGYLLFFQAASGDDHAWREIRVNVGGPRELRIRAREGYYP